MPAPTDPTDVLPDRPLGERHEEFTISPETFEQAVEAFEQAVLDGYSDPFEVFLINKTRAAETTVVVEGEGEGEGEGDPDDPSTGVLMDRVLVAETNTDAESKATFTLTDEANNPPERERTR